jgi:Flp pilus assembly pilin Flp
VGSRRHKSRQGRLGAENRLGAEVKIFLRLWRGRSGSALIEYSFLITIMIALIVIVVAVAGHWVAGMWVHLPAKSFGLIER